MNEMLLIQWLRWFFVSTIVWLGLAFPLQAEEAIRSYSVNLILLENGTVDVTETITVNAEGIQIKRGIFRDIPTTLTNDDGSSVRSNLNIVSIQKDQIDEPYFTEGIQGGTRIYLGESSVFLEHKIYTYTIRYTMTRMARYFETHDELYWNATGNFWNFPIQKAVVQISVPEGAVITEHLAYTGRRGERGEDYVAVRKADNVSVFRVTRPLAAREGISVVVPFQKGVLISPSSWQKALNWISDRRELVFPALAMIIVLIYYWFAWDAVGRDPKKGTIIPLFHAPDGFSPALSHHIHHMGWKKNGWTAFSAALIALGVKGLIKIEKVSKKKTVLTATGERADDLPPGEQIIFDYVHSKQTVTIDKSSGPTLAKKRAAFVKKIGGENRHAYFKNNFAYTGIGVLMSILCLIALVATDIVSPVVAIGAFGAGLILGLVSSAFSGMWSGGGFARFFVIVWLVIAGSNIFGGIATVFSNFTISSGGMIAVASIVLINVVFAILLRAPTAQGQKVMDKIEGFRMYLDTAEKERLNMVGEPAMTVQRFEKILPYAVALGVEKPWAKHFEGELARNAVADAGRQYHPGWYHGSSFSPGNLSSDVAAIGSGISAAMISAQPSSSSSSGGGGGGFSGGGGGGGGGGGW